MAPDAPTPPPAAPAAQQQTGGRTRWLLPTGIGVAGLLVGFAAGWLGHQAYLVHTIEQAFGGLGEDISEGMPAEEGEPAEEGDPVEQRADEGPSAPTEESDTDGVHEYSDAALGEGESGFTDTSTDTSYEAREGAVYVPVVVTAENVTDAETIPGYEEVFAYDADGVQYTSSMSTGEGAGYGLSPGLSASLTYHFEVPEGTELEWITIQDEDAAFEGRTEVAALKLS
ncbi:hypothetical protein [Nocardiopsis suaedae]|uniref:DUF4352 domain-containing protein n=1 Tax=Nocardiopsis suaedae TaxID=3018444 RepID=A0ABT4THL7_9ACTN|nr:hypothetical protein [Nocardiopsis suaedae]MDA2804203.1 hypothetical protein [Nocardiopsis suaedae]